MLTIFPYAVALLLYLLDIHYLTEEVELDCEIREPKGTKGIQDISEFNSFQLVAFVIATPLLLIYQLWDMTVGVLRIIFSQCVVMYYICQRRAEERKKRKSVLTRLYKTIRRLLGELWYIIACICGVCVCMYVCMCVCTFVFP